MGKLRNFLVLAVLTVVLTACPNPYRIAWITGSGFRSTAEQAEHVLAEHLKAKNTECLKTTKPRTPEYAACIKPAYDPVVKWIQYYRPAINSSLVLFVTSLQLAEASKDKKLPWVDYLMPGLCALAEVGQQWPDIFKDTPVKSLMDGLFKYLKIAACKKAAVAASPVEVKPEVRPAAPSVAPEVKP